MVPTNMATVDTVVKGIIMAETVVYTGAQQEHLFLLLQ